MNIYCYCYKPNCKDSDVYGLLDESNEWRAWWVSYVTPYPRVERVDVKGYAFEFDNHSGVPNQEAARDLVAKDSQASRGY
jgi:hypothetical protein